MIWDMIIYVCYQVQNDQCQSTDSQRRWMKISESDWDYHYVSLCVYEYLLRAYVEASKPFLSAV